MKGNGALLGRNRLSHRNGPATRGRSSGSFTSVVTATYGNCDALRQALTGKQSSGVLDFTVLPSYKMARALPEE